MKITVTTTQINIFILQTRHLLRERDKGYEADALPDGQIAGEVVTFNNLSTIQFCALEDAAVRMGLEYDGTQELLEAPGALSIPDQVLDATYEKLAQIFVNVREPGKSALVVFLEEEQLVAFTQEIGGTDAFRQTIIALAEQHRIEARKMNYPSDIPEAWQIVFPRGCEKGLQP